MAIESGAPSVAAQILSLVQTAQDVGQAGPKVRDIAARVGVKPATSDNEPVPLPQEQAESNPKGES